MDEKYIRKNIRNEIIMKYKFILDHRDTIDIVTNKFDSLCYFSFDKYPNDFILSNINYIHGKMEDYLENFNYMTDSIINTEIKINTLGRIKNVNDYIQNITHIKRPPGIEENQFYKKIIFRSPTLRFQTLIDMQTITNECLYPKLDDGYTNRYLTFGEAFNSKCLELLNLYFDNPNILAYDYQELVEREFVTKFNTGEDIIQYIKEGISKSGYVESIDIRSLEIHINLVNDFSIILNYQSFKPYVPALDTHIETVIKFLSIIYAIIEMNNEGNTTQYFSYIKHQNFKKDVFYIIHDGTKPYEFRIESSYRSDDTISVYGDRSIVVDVKKCRKMIILISEI